MKRWAAKVILLISVATTMVVQSHLLAPSWNEWLCLFASYLTWVQSALPSLLDDGVPAPAYLEPPKRE